MNDDEKVIAALEETLAALGRISPPRLVSTEDDVYNNKICSLAFSVKEQAEAKYPTPDIVVNY